MTLVAYVSGHGFGHSTRTAEVLRAVREAVPREPLAVVTSAPESLSAKAAFGPFAYRRLACDVGLVQRGPWSSTRTRRSRACGPSRWSGPLVESEGGLAPRDGRDPRAGGRPSAGLRGRGRRRRAERGAGQLLLGLDLRPPGAAAVGFEEPSRRAAGRLRGGSPLVAAALRRGPRRIPAP